MLKRLQAHCRPHRKMRLRLPHRQRLRPQRRSERRPAEAIHLLIDLLLAFNHLIQLILTFPDLPTERINVALVIRELLLELV